MDDKSDTSQENLTPIELFDACGLHRYIVEVSRSLYESGPYPQAILEAFKRVDIEVGKAAGLGSLFGKRLMKKAFKGDDPVIKLNPLTSVSDQNEQAGFNDIFIGAIVGIRNPKGHDIVSQNDPYKTLEYLGLASLLLKRVDERIAG